MGLNGIHVKHLIAIKAFLTDFMETKSRMMAETILKTRFATYCVKLLKRLF